MAHTVPYLERFQSAYEIVDEGLASRREVSIRSLDSLTPRLGDLFTVEARGVVREVAVVKLATYQGGWSAICRISDVF